MDIQFRTFKETDTEGLRSLMAELGYTISLEDFKEIIRALHMRDGVIFVAETKGRLIGSSSVIIDVRLAEGISGEIASLVVSQNFRGQGVGKSLIQLSEQHLKQRVPAVRIRANVIRSKAHGYYKSLGYQEIKEQKVFVKPFSN